MKTKTVRNIKTVVFAVVFLLLAAVLIQVISVANSGVKTEAAVTYTVFDTITCQALAFRDEQVIESSASGVLNYSISNGEKVGAGNVIANEYSDNEDADMMLLIDELDRKIEELGSISSTGGNYVPDIDMINSQLRLDINSLVAYSSGRNLNKMVAARDELLTTLNKKQVVTGVTAGFDSVISTLEQERKELAGKVKPAKSMIISPCSGFFSSVADGYEKLLTSDELGKMSVEKFDSLYATEPESTEGTIGKVVTDYIWDLACEMSLEEAELLKVGNAATVSVPMTSVIDAGATVTKIIRDEDSGKAVVILELSMISEDIIDLRKDVVQIHTNKYTGLKVSASAIRIVNEKKGVYILSGVEAKFVTVELLYTSADYSICDYGSSSGELCLYDEIVISGTDLYDGKVID